MEYPAGWTCERTLRELEAYLLSTILLAESLAVAEHLEACEGCLHRLTIIRMRLVGRPHG